MSRKSYSRSPELLSRDSSRLLIVDVQAKLMPLILHAVRVIDRCVKLIQAAGLFDVPVSATEQYPKGLGGTVPELARLLPDRPDKLRFSCGEVLPWVGAGPTAGSRFQIVVAGIEAHVCVLQTTFDLMSAGFEVYVVADAVSSRGEIDTETAFKRMADSGARLVTTEMVLFEWCEESGTDVFKQVSKLITGRP